MPAESDHDGSRDVPEGHGGEPVSAMQAPLAESDGDEIRSVPARPTVALPSECWMG